MRIQLQDLQRRFVFLQLSQVLLELKDVLLDLRLSHVRAVDGAAFKAVYELVLLNERDELMIDLPVFFIDRLDFLYLGDVQLDYVLENDVLRDGQAGVDLEGRVRNEQENELQDFELLHGFDVHRYDHFEDDVEQADHVVDLR